MEDTSNVVRKVANPAATVKSDKDKQTDDGLVMVEYTRKSVKYPGRARVPKPLAVTLEKSGKAVIIKN